MTKNNCTARKKSQNKRASEYGKGGAHRVRESEKEEREKNIPKIRSFVFRVAHTIRVNP